ncbi:ASKHA domain-containing protein [Flavonifractor sp. DFI.6.63]|uniref:ASKHA domain-containing protein n=1 Tax=Flavonifractor sp. DFI.6.63 TaxID=2963704 RepID=UPI00210A7848|nr:ASKHA domain-containing protein [Flavonifractor sp. DFI.6.63]MCQ5030132.1 ASKHA domain-containing protein [Flavonifractor sp. DFI.6.63]
MPVITVHGPDGTHTIEGRSGETLLSALQRAGLREPEAPCGGNGTCGKCLAAVSGAVTPADAQERALLPAGGERRLACRTRLTGDCSVTLDALRQACVVCEGASRPVSLQPWVAVPECGGLGAAADIGTTTVVVTLYDLTTGALLGTEGGMNRQRVFGADVISRIQYANTAPDGLARMTSAIREQVSQAVCALCGRAGRSTGEVLAVTAVGNTIMEHLFAGRSPASIAAAPFTPQDRFGAVCSPGDGFFPAFPQAQVYLAPAVAGYVGGDITAGLYASGAWLAERAVLFLDIGTNGEMALGTKDGFTTCATAAGPAFEGAEISRGMSGVAGAVDRVWLDGGAPRFSVIGGGAPAGICGSGLVDALAVLLRMGAVDGTGRLLPPDEAPAGLEEWLEEDARGVTFWLDRTHDIGVTEADVRKLQLAKAAIAAGIRTLLEHTQQTMQAVSVLYLAGGFGSRIDKENAGAIGLLPPELVARTRCVGNSASAGAAAALLSRQARDELTAIRDKCRYLELSTEAAFTRHYVDCMLFEP